MADSNSDDDPSDLPDFADRDDVIWFLEQNDVPLPEGLTIEKIESRGRWYAISEESFSFRIERHPSGPFSDLSSTGRGMPTPARWHVRKRYSYDLTAGQWTVTELSREFAFDSWLLVDAEFERLPRKDTWDQAIARARDSDDPEEVLDEQLAATERSYRDVFGDVPEDQLDEMLAVLEEEFRRRADFD
jgi:hypothetical protein